MNPGYNRRIASIKPSASMMFVQRAKELQQADPSIIGLAGGEPDFATPEPICRAAAAAMQEGFTHYTPGNGIPELRRAISEKLARENHILCSPDNILVTPGGKYAIYLAVNALADEGDEVMILDPAWVSYEAITLTAGAVPVHVHLDHQTQYAITREQLEAAVTEKTRILIINYPNNPTGRVLSRREAAVLEQFLLAHPRILLLSDEVYERLLYDGSENISMASRSKVKERVLTVNGFSKSAAMTGWRLGYIAAPNPYFEPIFKLSQHSSTCVSSFVQRAGVVALQCTAEMDQMCEIYRQRRDLFVSKLNEIPGVHCDLPQGAFYAWARFDIQGMSSEAICEYLITHAGVVGMPGTAYGETAISAMRFSFANATEDMLRAGEQIKQALLAL